MARESSPCPALRDPHHSIDTGRGHDLQAVSRPAALRQRKTPDPRAARGSGAKGITLNWSRRLTTADPSVGAAAHSLPMKTLPGHPMTDLIDHVARGKAEGACGVNMLDPMQDRTARIPRLIDPNGHRPDWRLDGQRKRHFVLTKPVDSRVRESRPGFVSRKSFSLRVMSRWLTRTPFAKRVRHRCPPDDERRGTHSRSTRNHAPTVPMLPMVLNPTAAPDSEVAHDPSQTNPDLSTSTHSHYITRLATGCDNSRRRPLRLV
jgi:hypothetical protein